MEKSICLVRFPFGPHVNSLGDWSKIQLEATWAPTLWGSKLKPLWKTEVLWSISGTKVMTVMSYPFARRACEEDQAFPVLSGLIGPVRKRLKNINNPYSWVYSKCNWITAKLVDCSELFSKSDAHPGRPWKLIGSGCIACLLVSSPQFSSSFGNKSNSDWWNQAIWRCLKPDSSSFLHIFVTFDAQSLMVGLIISRQEWSVETGPAVLALVWAGRGVPRWKPCGISWSWPWFERAIDDHLTDWKPDGHFSIRFLHMETAGSATFTVSFASHDLHGSELCSRGLSLVAPVRVFRNPKRVG